MFLHNDYVLLETQRTHRKELRAAAEQERLLRSLHLHRINLVDRGLCGAGRLMVRLGHQLEQRGNASPAAV